MRELRGFQREDVEYVKKNGHRVLIASAPGTGKTIVAIRSLVEEHLTTLPALVVCPASVVRNWAKEIKKWAPGVFVHCVEDTKSKIPFKRDNAFYVVSWDLLRLRWREFLKKIRAIIGDECFPAGTLISTPSGDVPIEDVQVGQTVWAWTGQSFVKRKVLGWSEKTLREELVRVVHESGSIVCTASHKIWTTSGYVRAQDLRDHVLVLWQADSESLHKSETSAVLRQEVLSSVASVEPGVRQPAKNSFGRHAKIDPVRSAPGCVAAHENTESHEESGDARKNGCNAESYGACTSSAGQGAGSFSCSAASECTVSGSHPRTEHRRLNSLEESHGNNSLQLQHRFGVSGPTVGSGGGRRESPFLQGSGTRCYEDSRAGTSRVARVEVQEQGDFGRFGEGGYPDRVFDLEVEGEHNYVADGVVVSNCHFIKNDDALRTQAFTGLATPLKRVILMSGTPIVNTVSDMNVLYQLLGSENPPMIRRLLEDVAPDVPQKSRSYLRVSLKERDRKIYEHAKEEFEEWLRKKKEELLGEGMAEDEVERAMAAEALVKVGYLRRLVGEAKVAAAAEWISRAIRLGEPVVVFAEHQAVIKKLSVALKKQRIQFGVLDGAASVKTRQALVDDFQNHNISVFIGSKAAKEGITLHAARHLLFIERFFTAAEEEQAEDRIRRLGQKFQTTIWFLHAPETIDDRVDQIVRSKRQIVRTAIGAPHTAETDEGNVCALIRSWGEHVSAPSGVDLGHSPPLPALPRARNVLEIVFTGDRWRGTAPKLWCRMNGYSPRRMEVHPEKRKVLITRYDLFRPNSFKIKTISKDIKMIIGERLHFENKERVVKATRRNQG